MTWSYHTNVGEIWNLILCSIGILLLLFLCFDIRRYMSLVMGMHKGSNNFDGIRLVEGDDGELHIEVPMKKGQKKHVPEYYGFTSGRHAGSSNPCLMTLSTHCSHSFSSTSSSNMGM